MDQESNNLLGGEKEEKMKGLDNLDSSGLSVIDGGVKAAEMTDTDQETNENAARNRRVCDICGKTFDSGKALGGHRRSHSEALKAKGGKPKKKGRSHSSNLHRLSEDENLASTTPMSNDETPTCCICGKSFPSMKSLFGHMRSHPGRLWRGILPPPTPVTDDPPAPPSDERNGSFRFNSSNSEEDEEVSHDEDFSSAPVLDDPSKDPPSKGIKVRLKVMDKSVVQAAECLMSLSRGNRFYSNSNNIRYPDYHLLHNNNNNRVSKGIESSSSSNERVISSVTDNDGKRSGKIKLCVGWPSNMAHNTDAAAGEEKDLLRLGSAAAAATATAGGGEAENERQWQNETLTDQHESVRIEATDEIDPRQAISQEASQTSKVLNVDLNLPYVDDEGI